MQTKAKNTFKLLLKLGFIFLAFYIVFSKISLTDLRENMLHTNGWYLFLALLFFNFSKILSSVRLNVYFRHIGVMLSEWKALKLYYIGMFYNLFLPGGIGGDGYKIYLLKKADGEVGLKSLVTVTLLDRISGLIPLLFLGGLLFLCSDFYGLWVWLDTLSIIGTLAAFPLLFLFTKYFFQRYLPLFVTTSLLGTLVQVLQLISALCIVCAMHIEHLTIIFLTLFLLSSVMAVLPVSIGGMGVRELTFLYGLSLLSIDAGQGVAFSLFFFLITAFSSLTGIFLRNEK